MVIYQQAAAIPFILKDKQLKILLITSRNNKKWIIPKGLIEDGDDAETTALKEALEEAGVSGEISGAEVGRYEYEKWGGRCKVEVFPLHVKDVLRDWDENFRTREWLDPETALKKVQPNALKKIIRKFIKNMNGSIITG